jgi:hypothetical protein
MLAVTAIRLSSRVTAAALASTIGVAVTGIRMNCVSTSIMSAPGTAPKSLIIVRMQIVAADRVGRVHRMALVMATFAFQIGVVNAPSVWMVRITPIHFNHVRA